MSGIEIQWDKNAIKALNEKIANIAQRNTSTSQKAADIVSVAKKYNFHFNKGVIKKMLDNNQIPKVTV